MDHDITKAGGYTGWRMTKDRLFRSVMTFGGLSVLIAISLIFFYLASVVVPLFMPAQLERVRPLEIHGAGGQALHLAVEEQARIALRADDRGEVAFFALDGGQVLKRETLPLDAAGISAFAAGDPSRRVFAYGLDDGRMLMVGAEYGMEFRETADGLGKPERIITPTLVYPMGTTPVPVDAQGRALRLLSVQHEGERSTAAALTADGRILLLGHAVQTNPITGESRQEATVSQLAPPPGEIAQLLLSVWQNDLYVVHGGRFVSHYDIADKQAPRLTQTVAVAPEGAAVSAAALLSGGISLIVGTDRGTLSQWFLVRDADNVKRLTAIRSFEPMAGPVRTIVPEHYRKVFLAASARGDVNLYHATAHRQLLSRSLGSGAMDVAAFAPRADVILVQQAQGPLLTAAVRNDFPEVSFHALWEKVWYEGYPEPEHVWQSSAAISDFEPKLSLAPLTFGTLKAAFYAMLLAVPLAVMGAIFTAYFMSPRMRALVKPSIEIMEALPTVILGFLAGLWLAPVIDRNLAGVFLAILMLPLSFVVTAFLWDLLPRALVERVRPGWQAALLVPVVVAVIYVALQLGKPIDIAFFDGSMARWIENDLGWSYEQRNSLVVGIAMGFAVIPYVFSISEDAVFSVPKHLTSGSLALGATPWQTLFHVVLLMASPGIFSAVMVGMGRAVGETMIVLMATGNTAIIDMSIFTGFRTLSANIGVEMREAAVGGTHYRLLFLSALVLFAFTFVVNTVAELVRHRLRERYKSL